MHQTTWSLFPTSTYQPNLRFPTNIYETVLAKLDQIKVHKAPGPEWLPNWVLRDYAWWLCESLCAVFNSSICQAKMPVLWKKANVLLVPKVNPPTLSLTFDLILWHPLSAMFLNWSSDHKILELVGKQLDDHQFGALKGRSTTHALVDMLRHWHYALVESPSVHVLFVDYAKAFDHVDHNIVLQKLKSYGVPYFIVHWIISFLSDRQQWVKIKETFSDWATLRGGMPQGSHLGPLIFIILIYDLRPELLTNKFVDDTTVSERVVRSSTSICNVVNSWSPNWVVTTESHEYQLQENKRWLSDHSLRTVWHLCQSHLCLLNASRLTSCWALWSIHRWSGTIILMPLRPKQQRDFGSWKHSSGQV